jgi:hypothetical protein
MAKERNGIMNDREYGGPNRKKSEYEWSSSLKNYASSLQTKKQMDWIDWIYIISLSTLLLSLWIYSLRTENRNEAQGLMEELPPYSV